MSDLEFREPLEAIAIVGISCRFPGAKNIEEFWRNLAAGREEISFFSDDELLTSGIDPAVLSDPHYVKASAILEEIEMFDAPFFGFTPREAEITDPQQRLFLEGAWEALENAGYNPETFNGSIGVYAGVSESRYLSNLYSNIDYAKQIDSFRAMIGNAKDYLPTMVSYKLNLKGPSISLQTACSTSLVAVHLAAQSLLDYQCDLALAGGVSISVPQVTGYLYQAGGVMSPDGHCRAFDAKALGTVGGNGVGIVVLKRLSEAIADRDYIHAVIKGSALNNDGAGKVGFTAPSVLGQAAVISMAQTIAGVDPRTIRYIEAHGSGTVMGDPIEVAALTRAFRSAGDQKNFCALGSVKTNFGHLGVAAGIAGLIKTVTALEHRMIPPCIHFNEPNPQIDFANTPFYVVTELSEWKAALHPRRAGVNSFGIGGTNVHVVLEEAPRVEDSPSSRPWQLLLLSARSDSALQAATTNLRRHLNDHEDVSLPDLAYTYQIGRKAFQHRSMLVCKDRDEALSLLGNVGAGSLLTGVQMGHTRPVVFMFSGLGDQYVRMGLGLYETEPTFRACVDECSEILKPLLDVDLRDVLYPKDVLATERMNNLRGLDLRSMLKRDAEPPDEATSRLNQTCFAHPAIFVIEYALARLWIEWGLRPQAMIGHSIGEYVAACLAGVWSLEDALTLVTQRARMIQEMEGGAMLAVQLTEEEIIPLLTNRLSLAAVNGPTLCVIAGPSDAVDELERVVSNASVVCRRLQASHAFHSKMMEPLLGTFAKLVAGVRLNSPTIPFISNVKGTWITAAEATDPNYWASHLVSTVRFARGLEELQKDDRIMLLEVGPGQSLTTLAIQQAAGDHAAQCIALPSMRHSYDRQPDVAFLLNTLGQLWLAGVEVSWHGFYKHEHRRRLPLPTYPFERQRYWVERHRGASGSVPAQTSRLGKQELANWFYIPSWRRMALRGASRVASQAEVSMGENSCWLLFVDECGLGRDMAQQVEQLGGLSITVRQAAEFAKLGDRAYQLNPGQCEHYGALLRSIVEGGHFPRKIVHLWSVTPSVRSQSGIELFESSQESGLKSLLFIAQSLGRETFPDQIQLDVITNEAQEVTGTEHLRPEQATALGLCKVIGQEYSDIVCRSIDINVPATSWQRRALAEMLVRESVSRAAEPVVAYRGTRRWVQMFDPIRLEGQAGITKGLREGGIYLLTGELNGVALTLAKYLVEDKRARLVIVDDRKSGGFTGNEKMPSGFDDLGPSATFLRADITVAEQMNLAVEQAIAMSGGLNGVIHVAGASSNESLRSISEINGLGDDWLFPARTHALYVLEEALRGVDVDFCLVVSSLSAILGGPGYARHASASSFVDSFVHAHNDNEPSHWLTVDWDTAATSDETVEIFRRLLSVEEESQIVISSEELTGRMDRWLKPEPPQNQQPGAGAERRGAYARPNLPGPYVEPATLVERTVADMWQEVLGIEEIGVHDNFFRLGGDSMAGLRLTARLRETFQVSLPVRILFEAPTVADLALVIEDVLITEIEETSSEAKQGAALEV